MFRSGIRLFFVDRRGSMLYNDLAVSWGKPRRVKEATMTEVAIRLPKSKLVEGLSTLSLKEIKEIMDALIEKELFRPPAAGAIYREASKMVKSKKLPSTVAEEAVRWSRSKK